MKLNGGLLFPALLLFFIGIFNLLGTGSAFIPTQLVALLLGCVIFFMLRSIGVNFFRTNAQFFYWIGVALLALTYLIGFESRGSKRWIDLFVFSIQPSEILKPFFAVFIAQYFAENKKWLFQGKTILLSFVYLAIPAILILKQPDLGTTLVYVMMFLPVLIYSGVARSVLYKIAATAGLVTPLLWMLLKEYQRTRLLSFLDPQADLRGGGYNLIQSMISIGSGQLIGRGLGYGTQSRLHFLPEDHTDFAYASLVEQFGFIGGVLVVALFGAFAYAAFRRLSQTYGATDSDSRFTFLYQVSITVSVLFQAIINMGMNMGLFPITGITLPFISYGGSSIIALCASLAFFF